MAGRLRRFLAVRFLKRAGAGAGAGSVVVSAMLCVLGWVDVFGREGR